ncbi:MAG: response regulator [Cyanobacteria bacterium CRU_2_1]|nr:response regulator [Cyanobacteria bacterium RU_5_0]NJR61851.1 response regulator [Cyanobacteria bacterium CRU_2_1]
MKILLVEDDKPTAAVLSEVLTAQHYTIDVATDGQIGLSLATSWNYDLILLDLLIPKLDGIRLCRQLRSQGYQKPILLLTIKDSPVDVVRGLDAGADDYVTKPYDLSELLARIRALLRRGEINLVPTVLTWGNLCVNPVSAEVRYGERSLSLSPKEYGLLGLFLRNPQRVFSRSDIIDRLWSIDASPSEGAVTNLIKDLRQKLKSVGMTVDWLETVYGLGYRLKPPPSHQEPATVPFCENNQGAQTNGQTGKGRRQKGLASVNKVLERYKDTFVERVVVLEQVEQAARSGKLSQEQRQTAAQEGHKLAGTLGSFGYEAGSKLAQAIEHLLMGNQPLAAPDLSQLATLITDLKQELTQPPKPLTAQQLELTPLPLVLVVDDEVSFTERLKTDAFAWGFRIEVAVDLAIAKQKIANASPNAILLSLSLHNINHTIDPDTEDPGTDADKLSLLWKFRQQWPTVPILVVTGQDTLTDRVVVSRLGAQRFLHKPLGTAEVFEAIAQVLPKPQTAEVSVMVLDDDPVMLDALSDLLQPWGIRVKTLHDPKLFWDVLTATDPDLLVLDLEMPTYNGIDLCRVVRQDSKWGNLPILVVTSHTDMESIQQVFAAGADDFIGKPIVGPELVTRVISRIDRSRLQQELETMKRRIGK